jgi:serine/threonine protein kinase
VAHYPAECRDFSACPVALFEPANIESRAHAALIKITICVRVLACRVTSLVPRLAPGSAFAERYKILEYVGQGSMGSVYRAEPASGGAVVALKLMRLDPADGRALRRFEREVESGRRIRSPYVAATLDCGKLGDSLAWLTMEFAPGVGLDELVRQHAGLSFERARRVLAPVFEALAAAHAEGIVHRDLKPENVRVSGPDDALLVKVLDFGIAKDFGPSTLSGTTPGLGTPLWAAPELSREGHQPAPSADVWSLGLLVFFVLTGRMYWLYATERASLADLAIELLKSDIAPPSQRMRELELDARLPRDFDGWFGRAVNREPAQRFRDASEAWAELEPLLAESLPEPSRLLADRPALVVRPGPFVTAVILSCVAAGFVIYWLLRSMHI